MRKGVLMLIALITLIILIFTAFFAHSKKRDEALVLNKNNSWYSSFEIVGGNVNIYCHLEIVNKSKRERRFSIFGYSEDDYQAGLIKSEQLQCLGNNGDSNVYIFSSDKESLELDVIFVGEHGISNEKQNRLLPEKIVFIDNETGEQYLNIT